MRIIDCRKNLTNEAITKLCVLSARHDDGVHYYMVVVDKDKKYNIVSLKDGVVQYSFGFDSIIALENTFKESHKEPQLIKEEDVMISFTGHWKDLK